MAEPRTIKTQLGQLVPIKLLYDGGQRNSWWNARVHAWNLECRQ